MERGSETLNSFPPCCSTSSQFVGKDLPSNWGLNRVGIDLN